MAAASSYSVFGLNLARFQTVLVFETPAKDNVMETKTGHLMLKGLVPQAWLITHEVNTHRWFGRRVEVEPVLRLLRTELSQGEDALRHRTFPGVVCLQTQHQSAAAQLLETQRKHEGLHEGHILKNRDSKNQVFFFHNDSDNNPAKLVSQRKCIFIAR